MPIYLIDKIQQKNNGTFKLVDASDIEWDIDVPITAIPDGDGENGFYTKLETDKKIQEAIVNSGHLSRKIVADLPSTGDPNIIYMVKRVEGESANGNSFDEYMWIQESWEYIGSSQINLTGYLTKTEADSTYANKTDLSKLASIKEVNDKLTGYLPLNGGAMRGKISGIITPTENDEVANKEYVDNLYNQISSENFLTIFDIESGSEKGTISIKGNDIEIAGLGSAAYANLEDIDFYPEWIVVQE